MTPALLGRTLRLLALFIVLAVTGVEGQELPAASGWAALEQGNGSKAAAIFRDALDRSPSDPILHYGSAQASLILGRTDAAIASLKRAVEYNPNFAQAHMLLARVAYDAADLDLAVRSLERAAALVPRDRRLAAQLAEWKKESQLHQSFQTQATARFTVLFEGPAQKATGDRVTALLESAYANVGRSLNLYPGNTLEVILYSRQQFHDITRAPDWSGGGYDGRIRLPIAGALKTPQTLDRVITHEYVHAVVRHAAGRDVPAWVNEGLASYLEPGDKTWARRVLREANERIPLEDLAAGFGRFNEAGAVLAYAESLVAAELLCERLAPHVGPFLQLLGNGYTVDQALSRHGINPEAFYADWRKRVTMKAPAR